MRIVTLFLFLVASEGCFSESSNMTIFSVADFLNGQWGEMREDSLLSCENNPQDIYVDIENETIQITLKNPVILDNVSISNHEFEILKLLVNKINLQAAPLPGTEGEHTGWVLYFSDDQFRMRNIEWNEDESTNWFVRCEGDNDSTI